jgi:DNA-binding NtrC family response regulator
MSTVRVLCVENHVEYLDALKYMLETAGYEVVSATTGNQGLSMLTTQPIQGVLLEYDLPDATGSSVRAEMKRIKPDVPVLLFCRGGKPDSFSASVFRRLSPQRGETRVGVSGLGFASEIECESDEAARPNTRGKDND